jgi:hypothetical protein
MVPSVSTAATSTTTVSPVENELPVDGDAIDTTGGAFPVIAVPIHPG